MQVYVKDSNQALELYQNAFKKEAKNIYRDDEGKCLHAEIDLAGNILSLSEKSDESIPGNTMQFCIQYGKEQEDDLQFVYDLLKEDAEIFHDLGPCFYSSKMADFIDKFGVRWCIFI